MASSPHFGLALETAFQELAAKWLSATPAARVITDERVLRELSLPPDAQTRLCFFAVPLQMVSLYREVVFPIVDDVGLVPATGEEISGVDGSTRAMLESLLRRAYVLIADASTGDRRVLSDVQAAAQRVRPPLIGVITEEDHGIDTALPSGAQFFTRPRSFVTASSEDVSDAEAGRWLEHLRDWLERATAEASGRLEEEALRLLEQGMYRAAVIAASSAVEVTLRDLLHLLGGLDVVAARQKSRIGSPMTRMLDTALTMELITPSEHKDLRELQRTRNELVHSATAIDGRRARPLVDRAVKVVSRLRDYRQP